MSKEASHFAGVPLDLEDENALLRASLAAAHERLHEMEQSSDADALTGLPGRRRYIDALEQAVGRAGRHGTPAAVLTIDLKGLSAINEAHGRLAGDCVLVHVANLLSDLIRSTDLLARTAGGRFSLILDHLDQNSAIDASERLARCIHAQPVDLGGRRIAVEAAIAVTGILSGDTVEEVLERSDRNLIRAKTDF